MAERDPEIIKQEIAAARDRLAVTVDSLAERANPHRVAEDLKVTAVRFLKQPAVAATIDGVGVLTLVGIIRAIRR